MKFREFLIHLLVDHRFYKRHGEMLEDLGGHLTHEDLIPMAALQADFYMLSQDEQDEALKTFHDMRNTHQD